MPRQPQMTMHLGIPSSDYAPRDAYDKRRCHHKHSSEAKECGPACRREHGEGLGARIPAAKVGCIGDFVERYEDRAPLCVQAHVVAQVRVLTQVGVKLGQRALTAEPLLIPEDAQERAVGLIEDEEP